LRKKGLKPSSIVTVASKVSVYEDYLLKLVASKCRMSRSSIVRIAILLLLAKIVSDSNIKNELIPGYEDIVMGLSSEAKEELQKCLDKLRYASSKPL